MSNPSANRVMLAGAIPTLTFAAMVVANVAITVWLPVEALICLVCFVVLHRYSAQPPSAQPADVGDLVELAAEAMWVDVQDVPWQAAPEFMRVTYRKRAAVAVRAVREIGRPA